MIKYKSRTYIAVPPGESIKEQLEFKGMTQKEFAARMDMSEKHISRLLNGDVQLTPETAVKLEMVLGVPARVWNNYEALYREEIIKVNIENSLDDDVKIAERLPYKELAEAGWVPSATKISEKVINLRKFFEVIDLSLLENDLITKKTGKKTDLYVRRDLVLISWIQTARLRAREIETAPVNIKKLGKKLVEIKKLTLLQPSSFCPEIESLLAECGIVLVFMPSLNGLCIDNKTFTDGNKIVIACATGEYEAGQFWLMLFNELAHIFLGHIGKNESITDDNEKDADVFTGNLLIEHSSFDSFCSQNDFSERSVLAFAKELGINPGIVVGRMQTNGLIEDGNLNSLKTKYNIA